MAKPNSKALEAHQYVCYNKAQGTGKNVMRHRTPCCPTCSSKLRDDQWNKLNPRKSEGNVVRCVACDELLQLEGSYVKEASQDPIFIGLSATSVPVDETEVISAEDWLFDSE